MLSDDQILEEVSRHFSSGDKLTKEIAETTSVFHVLATSEPVSVLSLACGSAVGTERFQQYFPHKDSTFHGMDIVLNQTTEFLMGQRKIHSFSKIDLTWKEMPSEVVERMRSSSRWMAIHACRDLANTIVRLFKQHGQKGATLLVVPCCFVKNTIMKERIGIKRWKELRDECQGRQGPAAKAEVEEETEIKENETAVDEDEKCVACTTSTCEAENTGATKKKNPEVPSWAGKKSDNPDWKSDLAVAVRNELLAMEFQEGFVKVIDLIEIPSRQNKGLLFVHPGE